MKSNCLFILFLFILTTSGSAQPEKKIPEKDLESLIQLQLEVTKNLTDNILKYWIKNVIDPINGGFYGRVDFNEKKYPEAEKGGILNARILWTFSAAYRVTKNKTYLEMAKKANSYILEYFVDHQSGGTFRSVTNNGIPEDTRKQTYSQSFMIYGLSEYFRATGDQQSLEQAKVLFRSLEKYALDTKSGGYFEAFDRDWKRIPDLIIGEKSAKDEKTMNTTLHMMESYASLYRVWKDPQLAKQLKNLIILFRDKIINQQSYHLNVFLDKDWNNNSTIDSYGHDIEASWLLVEASKILGDPQLIEQMKKIALKIADAASEGLQPDGSLAAEKDYADGKINLTRDWWPQAETVVGLLNAYELTHNDHYLAGALKNWNYTNQFLVDHKNGEWYSSVTANGSIVKGDKAGFWKCPYHNGRMCMEVMERVDKLMAGKD